MTISPVVDSTGTIVGASNIARDITPRKFKEEQLRQSEDRFRLFIEHAPAALAMFDREMRYLQVSRRWRTDYGLGERELHGLSHYEILPEVPERWKEIHRRGLAGEVLRGEDDYLDRSDGSVRWISWEVRPWHDRTGEIAGIVIFAEEITERKRAEHGLRDSEEKLRLALDGARLGTWEWDLKTGKLAGSPLSFALFRLPADTDFNFGMFLSMIHPDDRARADEAMKRTLADHTEYNVEYRLVWPDGSDRWIAAKGRAYQNDAGENFRVGGILFDVTERRQALAAVQQPGPAEGVFLEVSARPLKDDHGNLGGGVAVLRDITERKAAERQIQTLNQRLEGRVVERTAELQVANKELEAFTYSISHDLRAPIRHINGFTKILLEQFRSSLPAEALGHLQLIDHAAARMGQMVDEMLKLARLGRQALTVKVTGLSSLVEDVINLLTLETEGRQVEWRIGQLPFVECDPILMPQVFQNLISNALKYSRPRSPAVIEIGQTEKEGEKVIFVKDNGVGFDMKYSDKLFGVFQRLHLAEEFEGNGIGLATVERIIKKHGGRVWVEAELDRGATFFFTLGDREHFAPARAAVAAGGTL
jgi:PAS domain S-box-containing protein